MAAEAVPMLGGLDPNFQPMDWPTLAMLDAPERPWIVPRWLPRRALTLLAGSGGTGKSLWAQQWGTAVACGVPLVGDEPAERVPVLYVNCEDDHDELWRRQVDINRALGVKWVDIIEGKFHVFERLGLANYLSERNERGNFVESALLKTVRVHARTWGAKLIIFDNLAHHFAENENDRAMVTGFCAMLSALAVELDAAVVVIAHPAKGHGSEYSGSTAWEAAVRNRLYLSHEMDGDGNEVVGSDVRTLSVGKSNYAEKGLELRLRWKAGAFQVVDDRVDEGAETRAEAAFLTCLDAATEQRRNVSDKPSQAYAPKVFEKMPEAGRVGYRALEGAMRRLFARRQIVAGVALWKDSGGRWKYGIQRVDADQMRLPEPPLNPPQGPPTRSPEPPEPLDPNRPPQGPYILRMYGEGDLGSPLPDTHADAGDE